MSAYVPAAQGEDLLYQVLDEHLQTFLAACDESGVRVPKHARQELEDYLACGMREHGFALLRCDGCGTARAVAFSCLDGVYEKEAAAFHPAPSPSTADVQLVVDRVRDRVEALLRARGLLDDEREAAQDDSDEDGQHVLLAASCEGPAYVIASGRQT